MFRKMRRSLQELTAAECESVLRRNTNGVLAVIGDDGYPYGVPLSYVYSEGKVWFHCAKSGHKIDAIRKCSKVSFTVVDQDEVLPEKLATDYRSVILFGQAQIEDDESAATAIRLLCDKYSHGYEKEIEEEIRSVFGNMYMVRIDVEHMSGKQSKRMAMADRERKIID